MTDDLTTVYLPRGTVAHALDAADSPNTGYARALCGVAPSWPVSWHGTGSQDEHERAELLPFCRLCSAVLARASSG